MNYDEMLHRIEMAMLAQADGDPDWASPEAALRAVAAVECAGYMVVPHYATAELVDSSIES